MEFNNSLRVIQYDDDFFELPNMVKARQGLDRTIDDCLRNILESFHHIHSSSVKRKIRLGCKQHMNQRLTQLIKQMARQPFSDLLGIQGNAFDRHQVVNEWVLKEMEAFIRIAQEVSRQEASDEELSIEEDVEGSESDWGVPTAMKTDGNREASRIPFQSDVGFSSPDREGVLREKLTELREHNRRLLDTLNDEKEKNERFFRQYREEMQQQGKSSEEIEMLLADPTKFKMANPPEFDVGSEIQELGKCHKRKWPLPPTMEGKLEKKIKGVKHYQNQLQRNIEEAKKQNSHAKFEISKQRQARHQAIFHNEMTFARWRREYIPYSDSDSDSE